MGWGLPASGGLKTFFPWKVAASVLLSGELSAPSCRRPGLRQWAVHSSGRASLLDFLWPGLGWEHRAGVSRAVLLPGQSPEGAALCDLGSGRGDEITNVRVWLQGHRPDPFVRSLGEARGC